MPLDLEDSYSPPRPASSKFRQALSGFASNAPVPNTRSRSKRMKVEEPNEESALFPLAGRLKLSQQKSLLRKGRWSKRGGSTPAARKPEQKELDVTHTASPYLRETRHLIKEMRKKIFALVETMGCAGVMKDEGTTE